MKQQIQILDDQHFQIDSKGAELQLEQQVSKPMAFPHRQRKQMGRCKANNSNLMLNFYVNKCTDLLFTLHIQNVEKRHYQLAWAEGPDSRGSDNQAYNPVSVQQINRSMYKKN